MATKKPALSPLPDFTPLGTTTIGASALREIVVFIDGRADAAGILEFAAALAKEHEARLISVFMQPDPEATPAQMFARGTGTLVVILDQQKKLDHILTAYYAPLESSPRRHGTR